LTPPLQENDLDRHNVYITRLYTLIIDAGYLIVRMKTYSFPETFSKEVGTDVMEL